MSWNLASQSQASERVLPKDARLPDHQCIIYDIRSISSLVGWAHNVTSTPCNDAMKRPKSWPTLNGN